MKNLRLFKFHANYLNNKFIMTRNELFPIASTCLDDNDLHIDNMFEYVNYIEGDGNSYINTKIPLNIGKQSLEIKYKFNDLERAQESVFGQAYRSTGYHTLCLLKFSYDDAKYPNKLYGYMALNSTSATSATAGQNTSGAVIDVTININNNYVFNWNIEDTKGAWDIRHNGTIRKTGDGSAYYNATIAKDLFLFARGGSTSTTATSSNTMSSLDVPFKGRIYYVKIWNGLPENNDIAHYLVPIRLMPGNLALQRYGFIDKVTNKMYFSSTSVEFTGG